MTEGIAPSAAERATTLRALLDALPDLMFRLRADGTYLEFAGDATLLASPPEELVGSSVHDVIPAEIAGQLVDCARAAIESGELKTVEYRLVTLSGVPRDFEARVVPSTEDEVVMIVRDFTDRRRLERELRGSRQRLVETADIERRRLGRDLHDGAQQRLVSVLQRLHLARRQLASDPVAVERLLAEATDHLKLAYEELRELARGIHPVVRTEGGLAAALRALVARSHVPVELAELPREQLPEAAEVAAYYVAAEALTNVAKYARAEAATLSVERRGDRLVVEVGDDGVGGADPARGTGLRGLADRVEALGGSLAVDSPPGGGTRLRAEIPCG